MCSLVSICCGRGSLSVMSDEIRVRMSGGRGTGSAMFQPVSVLKKHQTLKGVRYLMIALWFEVVTILIELESLLVAI